MTERRKTGGVLAFLMTLALVLALSACGGSSDGTSETTSTSDATTAEPAESAEVAEAEEYLETNGKGVGGPLPDQPAEPAADKEVWILSCTQLAAGCKGIGAGVEEAAEAAGFDVTLVDGEADISKWNAIVDQARVAGVDALVSLGVDCSSIKQPLERAKKAGMVTELVAGFDCNDETQGETEALYTHTVEPEAGTESWVNSTIAGGGLQAAWLIANVPGKKEAIQFTSSDVFNTRYINKGFKEQFDCAECSIVGEVQFHLDELGSPLTQKAEAALLKWPNANVTAPPYDPVSTSTAQAIVKLGRTDSVYNTGLLAAPENIELIRSERGQAMSVSWDYRWLGWAATDDIVRLFNGEEPVYSGWSQGIVDKESLPEGEAYFAPVDYIKNYEELWGVR